MLHKKNHCQSEEQLIKIAMQLADNLVFRSFSLYLSGDLGAGKTTFARGLIRYFGYTGCIKSPTFSLVESYEFKKQRLYHFDLYRIETTEELINIGIDDYFSEEAIRLIEWPERGAGFLQKPDLWLSIETDSNHDRILTFRSETQQGEQLLYQEP